MSSPRKPVLLVIRDGWGDNPRPEQDSYNATHLAKKPCDDALHARSPVALVRASGLDVGVGSSRVDLQACKLEYSIVSPK